MRIALLGVGLIGGSIGKAVRSRLDHAEVVGFDPGDGVLEAAADGGAIDRAATSIEDALDGAEACFGCAPVDALPELITAALGAADADCVVSDVGSTKRAILAGANDERFVGGHPVAGSEAAGVEGARADLFEDATWYLTPGERTSGVLYERLHRLVSSLGARPVAIDAEAHDRALAAVSHLPHVLANVLVAQVAEGLSADDGALPRVGPSFRDATRVAGANSGIWTGIYTTNAEAIAEQIDGVVARLGEVSTRLRDGDPAAVRDWNERARADRRALEDAALVGGALHELRVAVPNRPGVVAEVALELGRAGINISDLSLAPAPDMLSGAMTLWIAGDEPANRARALVEALGFPVSEPS